MLHKTGWLEKEGMSGVRWNRRFVCVQRGSLRYWSEDPGSAANSKRCKGSMQICEDTVVSPTKQARPGRHAFRIDLGMQKFVLSASSEAEVDEWVEAVVRTLFGYRPSWRAERLDDALLWQPRTPRGDFVGSLRGVRTPFGLADITAGPDGLTITPSARAA